MNFRQRLDSLLGYVTMYKLTSIGLMAIAAVALLLMTVGHLPYSPISFLIGITVLLVSAYASNKLFGWLYGIKPHLDSVIITALILALLFTPPITFVDGAKLAIVAVIAMASKYILSFRGKHIFNPAAVAIVIASVSGIAYAGWWVASSALLPITAVVAALILAKVQKFMMAFTFLAVATAAIIFVSLLNGIPIQNVFSISSSWPLVFLAGVMLVEPLTLPPKLKQQLIVAALVGVLLALPLHYAVLTMTPALALVVGNAVAFYMGIRMAMRLRFVGKTKLSGDIYKFTFDVGKFRFEAGQFIELSAPHAHPDFRGSRRIFSIIGQPMDEQISIATRLPKNHSTYKTALMSLKSGTVLHGLRVGGDFVLPDDKSAPILCIAGGIGITPFVAYAMNEGERDITILYSVKSLDDLAFAKEFSHYDVDVVVVSEDAGKLPNKDWKLEKGRVTPELINKYRKSGGHVYVSGPPIMVDSVTEMAKSAGADKVHNDIFSGY